VRFRREVADGVDGVLVEDPAHRLAIADVRVHEDVARAAGGRDILQARRIAGVGERVEVDDPARIPGLGEDVADEVRADEAGAAGDEEVSECAHVWLPWMLRVYILHQAAFVLNRQTEPTA